MALRKITWRWSFARKYRPQLLCCPRTFDYRQSQDLMLLFQARTTSDIITVWSWPSISGWQALRQLLFLLGRRQAFETLFFIFLQQQLPMVFNATITGDRWMGEALIPWSYFPPNVNKMNSYAIHGSGEKRTYEALYPIPKEEIMEGQQPNL